MSHKKIKKVFIANRGEVLRRIAHTAKLQNIETACVLAGVPPAYLAGVIDHYIFVPEENVALFLNQEKMISCAIESGCDAVHPGFGFLSENHNFARKVQEAGLIWIGPSPEAIVTMADKSKAREVAEKLQIPCTKALKDYCHTNPKDHKRLESFAKKADYPLLVKAALGGGGKGMRLVYKKEELQVSIEKAAREAKSSFDDDSLIIEEYIKKSRHVEVQIVGDHSGQVVVFGDRDCSVQRRHQKVLEEAPAPFLPEKLRSKLHSSAKSLAEEIGYTSCGTVEFLVSWDADKGQESAKKFYFLEMNTRLQVEHPVTEEVFGVDLVALQFKIAQGYSFDQNYSQRGHSIEARIYLEDPKRNFMPTPGYVAGFVPYQQKGIRWEIGLDTAGEVTSNFDPMVAKLIATASHRGDAIVLLKKALERSFLATEASNIPLICEILQDSQFNSGAVSTDYLQHNLPSLVEKIKDKEANFERNFEEIAIEAKERHLSLKANDSNEQKSDFKTLSALAFQKKYPIFASKAQIKQEKLTLVASETITDLQKTKFPIYYQRYIFDFDRGHHNMVHSSVTENVDHEKKCYIGYNGLVFKKLWKKRTWNFKQSSEVNELDTIAAEVPGKIVKVLIKDQDQVKKNQSCFVLESMKMEFDIKSTAAGVISKVFVAEGEQVSSGKVLAKLD